MVDIPPLRQRQGDAVLLCHSFLKRFASEQRRPALTLSEDAARAIELYGWPGNVRELQNLMKRASIMAEGDRITAEDIGLPSPGAEADDEELASLDLRSVRERAERHAVVSALARSAGSIVKAAEILGVSRPTLYDLMNRLQIK